MGLKNLNVLEKCLTPNKRPLFCLLLSPRHDAGAEREESPRDAVRGVGFSNGGHDQKYGEWGREEGDARGGAVTCARTRRGSGRLVAQSMCRRELEQHLLESVGGPPEGHSPRGSWEGQWEQGRKAC